MKKLSFLLIAAVMLLIPFAVRADEKAKVNVYLFRGEGCPHCEEAIEWFDNTLSKDDEYSSKYELVKYEVWYDQDNAELMDKVASALGTEANGVPFIVIGDKYYSGFAESITPDQIKEAINTYYGNSEYTDVVDAVINNKKIDPKKEKENSQLLPIVIVSAAAIVIVIGLIFFTKERE